MKMSSSYVSSIPNCLRTKLQKEKNYQKKLGLCLIWPFLGFKGGIRSFVSAEYETIIKTFVSNWLPMRKLTAFIYPV